MVDIKKTSMSHPYYCSEPHFSRITFVNKTFIRLVKMKFSYKFNNLLGTVYKKGDLLFTPDGNSVITTVGNRISIFDLKNNKSNTLPIESKYNYVTLDITSNGCTLIAINQEGEAHMISLISQTITHKYRFKGKCRAIRFSPDGKHFAVCKENNVFVFKAPGPFLGQYNAFIMERVFHGAYDETTCLDWSSDSKILAVGSKDMATKLYSIHKCKNFNTLSLGSHTEGIVGCFFEKGSYDMLTISRNGQVCVWESTLDPDELQPLNELPQKKMKTGDDNDEDDIDITKSLEYEDEKQRALSKVNGEDVKEGEPSKLFYKRIARHYLADEVRKAHKDAVLSAAAYHKNSKILVIGFSTGDFFIHEAPEMNLIHSLNISEQNISSIALNQTGDWIALGCSGIGQLLVWEWQSETYVMKQQSHTNNMSCVSYSADGQYLGTGGEDGKVKLWNIDSGFCFVTFHEHSSAITAIAFSGNKKFIVSASLDGTIRAFDILRYRNFKTFTSPRPVQFSSVAVDTSGEFVAAGGQDVFEIYLWSVKTGRLLEILAGHEGPVASLAFSPNITNTVMVSASWDKTIRIWDAIEKGSAHETVELTADALFVAFNPNGQQVAVATLDGQISVFDVKTALQVACIEGRNDLGSGRSDSDLITAKKNLEAKAFTTLCYSADGQYILAGGQSKNVCIYNVKEALLLRKFEITQNRSLDAIDDFINRRKLTEFGNLALIEEREEREGGNVSIKLPGVRKGDMSGRTIKPEVRVFSLQFSPTGQQWAAATTEGLLIYSLSDAVFDPLDLDVDITPKAVTKYISEKDYVNAIITAIRMNDADLMRLSVENVPSKDVPLVISSFKGKYLLKLLKIVTGELEKSKHLEFYLLWLSHILTIHGPSFQNRLNGPELIAIDKALTKKSKQLSKLCEYNKYTMQYVLSLGTIKAEKEKEEDGQMEMDSEEDTEDNGEMDYEQIVNKISI